MPAFARAERGDLDCQIGNGRVLLFSPRNAERPADDDASSAAMGASMANPPPATLSLPGVLVAADLVGSAGFRTQVGDKISVALEAYSYHWASASDEERDQPVLPETSGSDHHTELLLTGVVLPLARPCELGGWVLDLGGVPIHVTDDQNGHEAGPAAGTWVRIRGTLNVADDYVVDEVERALQRTLTHPWLVKRIVRLIPYGYGEAKFHSQYTESIDHTGDASSYLLDLLRYTATH
jgi:hypothetical protein